MLALHAVHFEFRDRFHCQAPLNDAIIQGLNNAQVLYLRNIRSQALQRVTTLKTLASNLTDMTIPTLTSTNFDEGAPAYI